MNAIAARLFGMVRQDRIDIKSETLKRELSDLLQLKNVFIDAKIAYLNVKHTHGWRDSFVDVFIEYFEKDITKRIKFLRKEIRKIR